jgi:hypothetical protein
MAGAPSLTTPKTMTKKYVDGAASGADDAELAPVEATNAATATKTQARIA